jgi:hypothetical protein
MTVCCERKAALITARRSGVLSQPPCLSHRTPPRAAGSVTAALATDGGRKKARPSLIRPHILIKHQVSNS